MQTKEYDVLSVSKLKEKIFEEKRGIFDFNLQLKNNHVFVYKLKNGEVVLLPSSLMDNAFGILFFKKETFDSCLIRGVFPIKNDPLAIEEKYQKEILGLDSNIHSIISYIKNKFKIDSSIIDYKTLLTLSKSKYFTSLPEKDEFYLSLLLGECIRATVSGHWILLGKYGSFNPYYVPAILTTNNEVIILFDSSPIYLYGQINIEKYLEIPSIKRPALSLSSTFFKANYPEYKILGNY